MDINKNQNQNSENEETLSFEPETPDIPASNLNPELKKLRNKLKAKTEEARDNLAGWQRAKADYINLRNEFEKKKDDLLKFSNERIILDLLVVSDSFDLAFADRSAWEKIPADWRRGMESIRNQLEETLKRYGVRRLDALGQDFNPAGHESVGLVETTNKEEDHKILAVVKEGYELNGRVIRPAQVKIGQFKSNKQ